MNFLFRLAIVGATLWTTACAHQPNARTPAQEPAADLAAAYQAALLPSLPPWTDPYAEEGRPDKAYFQMSKLMKDLSLSRREAMFVQHLHRQIMRAQRDTSPISAFQQAVDQVRQARGALPYFNSEKIDRAAFVVVFDLDETLYSQYFKTPPSCADIRYPTGQGRTKVIRTTPNAFSVIQKINALGGAVVLYSANDYVGTLENLKQWKIGDQSLIDQPEVAGFMANGHLIRTARDSREDEDEKVVEPSKDLRALDPSLEKVIIVDDNPRRLFQLKNSRVVKKFKGDEYCALPEGSPARASYDRLLPKVLEEIEESLHYMKEHDGVSFIQAYAPYSFMGRVAVSALRAGAQKMSEAKAIEFLRENPKYIDPAF